MKKIQFSLLVVLAAFSLNASAQSISETPKGTQTQAVSRPQSPVTAAAAKKATAEINNLVSLDGTQQRMIFMAFLNLEEQAMIVKEATNMNVSEKDAQLAVLEAKKTAELQRILTPEQMATYNTGKAANNTKAAVKE